MAGDNIEDFLHDTIGGVRISTLKIPTRGDKPLHYETMILGGFQDGWMKRCLTAEEAAAQHHEAVQLVLSGRQEPS